MVRPTALALHQLALLLHWQEPSLAYLIDDFRGLFWHSGLFPDNAVVLVMR
jgi:hypothetical protein